MADSTTHTYNSLAEFAPDWIATPGGTVADVLEERGWTQSELAKRAGFSRKHVNLLLKGEAAITQDTAVRLEKVLGSSARFWLGLEAQYREQLAHRQEVQSLQQDVGWLKELPLADMIRFGWLPKVENKALQVHECLKYFAVSSVAAWRSQYQQPVAAYRAVPKLIRNPAAVSAWLREGESRASKIRCDNFNPQAFEHALREARTLTCERLPEKFSPFLSACCAKAGVAVVIAPVPKGCPVNGATKWLGPNKALIMLSVRGKSDDKLWFTFFHEAAHLLKHGKSLTFLDILGEDGLKPAEETEADTFARDFLLLPASYKTFVALGVFSATSIQKFARMQGVSPGIVVGRLQFDGYLPYSHLNKLKVAYLWNHEKP